MEEQPAAQCSYVGCVNKTLQKGMKFHYLPAKNAGLSVKWLINSGREDLLTYESTILESMKLAICSDHFQELDYDEMGNLKENTVPLQYWDIGYSCEPGEIKESDIDQQPQICSDESFESIDSEDSENDSEIGTDDEFRTQLGNEIEALLNAVQTSQKRPQNKRKQEFDETLDSFYKKLNIKGHKNGNREDHLRMDNLIEFKTATKDMCRTCAKKKSQLIDMADKISHADISIITKLKLLIEIKDHDVLPTKICEECLTKLEQSYKFFQQIYKADNILRDLLFDFKQSIKNSLGHNKCNGHVKTAEKSGDSETEKFCPELSDPYSRNDANTRWIGESNIENSKMNETSNFTDFDKNVNTSDIVEDKSSVNSEIYSSENTVSYLLSDFSNNDAELNWLDVVGIMKKKGEEQDAKKSKKMGKSYVGGLRISCGYCDSTFRLRRQLKTHITVDHLQPTNHMCEYCNICCKSEEHLLEHHAQAHSGLKYKCNDCGEMFKKKEKLLIHIEEAHSENKDKSGDIETCYTCGEKVLANEMTSHDLSHPDQIYTCNDCKKTFTTKRTLSNHIHRLHPPFAYTCIICNKILHTEADTYIHMTIHDKSPLFPCLNCGRMFYSTEKLEKHKNTHNRGAVKKRKRVWFHCQLCDASYRIADELIRHTETHTSEDWEIYRNKILYCGECNARLIGNEKFRIHKMRYHLARRGDYICLLCDEVTQDFQSLKEYEKHINLHSNELKRAAPRRYKCEHCDKAFKSNSHRINHIDSFHSNVTHSCPICNLKVKRKGNLKDHIRRVHNSKKQKNTVEIYVGDKRFPCRICGEGLLTAKQRDEHEGTHQEPFKDLEKMFPWTQRYTCDHCDMKFYYIHKLRQHLLDDHDDKEKAGIIEILERNRKFKCTDCEATFKHKSGLDTHVKGVHSGIEHTCPICGMKYKLATGLKKHMLNHDENRSLSFKCQYCDEQFEDNETRHNHELDNHTNDSKRIEREPSKCDDGE